MTNEKIHLVPQVVIDCAESLNNTKQDNLKVNYVMRLEAIRDYCDSAIRKHNSEINSNIWKRGAGVRSNNRNSGVKK